MQRKAIHVFLLHAVFLLALLSAFSGDREIYPRAFHAAGNLALGSLGEGRSVRFQWEDPAKRPDSADTRMLGREKGVLKYRWSVVYSSHRRLFWPTVALLAFTLATPMTRRRMAVAVLLGLLLFNLFFLVEVAAFAMVLFGAVGSAGAGTGIDWRRNVLPVVEALFNSPITNFSAVFFLWAWLARPARGLDLTAARDLLLRRRGSG